MRIFIHSLSGMKFPLEVESFDTIHHVKGLIREKKKICRFDQRLIFAGKQLEDSKTLADYQIQNESIMHLVIRLEGGDINIRTSFNQFTVRRPSIGTTIGDVKAVIEEEQGIPVIEQRLLFSGKELDNGGTVEGYGIRAGSTLRLVRLRDADKVVDIAAVKARKAALSKDKGTGNQAGAVSELPKVASKTEQEDPSSATPSHSKEGLPSCGDDEDLGLAWKRSRYLISPYDNRRFESESHRTLIESVANDCVRTLNVTAFLENKLNEYKDRLSRAENKVKQLTERNNHMEDSLKKEKDTFKKLVQELDVECSTGASFLQSEVGRCHIANLERVAAKSAVDEFKKGSAINVLVKDRAMSVYEDVVKECQSVLRESGRVSEDIIRLIGPKDEEEEELQKADDDHEDEEEEELQKADDYNEDEEEEDEDEEEEMEEDDEEEEEETEEDDDEE